MNKYRLEPQDTLIMIIDVQEKLMAAMKDKERVYKNINLLLETGKQLDIPVLVTEQYPRGLGPTVHEVAEHLADYKYMDKVTFSACNEGLFDILKEFGRKTVLITGSETHICVFQTARDLTEAGYNVHLVKDAVCSRFDENYENGIQLMRESGAVITNAETVVFDLLKQSGTPQFKVISSLVK
ncbi:MAG: hydrolase [Syntrophomonadaceae bacterium]|nr:hydrolase [Syntrophomonadaceae bacterium]